jgi:hypothetical protein
LGSEANGSLWRDTIVSLSDVEAEAEAKEEGCGEGGGETSWDEFSAEEGVFMRIGVGA